MALDVPTLVEEQLFSGSGVSTLTVDLPTGTETGDILILCAVAGCADQEGLTGFTNHAEITNDSLNWTEVVPQNGVPYVGGVAVDGGAFFAVFSLVVPVLVPTTVQLSTGIDLSAWSISIVRIRNVSAVAEDTPIVAGAATDPSTATVASILVADNDSVLVYCVGAIAMTQADLIVPPVGMTHVCHMFTSSNLLNPGTAIFVEGVDAGATGTRSTTLTPDGVGTFDSARPLATMLVVGFNGECAIGRTYVVGTDKIFTTS